jgi:hypothetical protein
MGEKKLKFVWTPPQVTKSFKRYAQFDYKASHAMHGADAILHSVCLRSPCVKPARQAADGVEVWFKKGLLFRGRPRNRQPLFCAVHCCPEKKYRVYCARRTCPACDWSRFCVGIEALGTVSNKVLWVITTCGSETATSFGGIYRFHLQIWRTCKFNYLVAAAAAGFLPGSFFDHEDGGDRFFRNVGFSTNNMALQPRRR